MTIMYSRGRNKFDNKPEQRHCADFDEFEQAVLNDVSQKKGQAFICSPLRSGTHYQKPAKYPGEGTWRLKDYVQPRQFIAFDFDGFSSPEVFEAVKAYMQRFRGFGYTTASHTEAAPLARVILLASRPMTRDECVKVSVGMEKEVSLSLAPGHIGFDQSVYRGEQPIYTPVIGTETFTLSGTAVVVDAYANIPLNRQSIIQLDAPGLGYVEPDIVPNGERNSAVLSLIGHLRATGEYEDNVISKVHEFNVTKCHPPLDRDEVDAVLDRYPEQQNARPSEMANDEWPEPQTIKPALRPDPKYDLDTLP